jgi:SAM-dependent methyltransferase
MEFRVGDMGRPEVPSASTDVIWSEGAIYVLGFEAGLRTWRPLLKPGGHVVVTEACWMRPDPPAECAAFWESEYPAIRDMGALLEAAATCGYDLVGHFSLPRESWWTDYYAPLQRNVAAFRGRHPAEPDAIALVDQVQSEIDIWRRYSEYYSYEFLVTRAR